MKLHALVTLALVLTATWALGIGLSLLIDDPPRSHVERGVLFGLALNLVAMPLVHIILSRWKLDGLKPGIRQRFSMESKLNVPTAATTLTLALRDLGVGEVSVGEGTPIRIFAVTEGSWRSFGEEIQMTVSSRSDGRTTVVLGSRPRRRTTVLDYGKNMSNVRHLRDALRAAEDRDGEGAG